MDTLEIFWILKVKRKKYALYVLHRKQFQNSGKKKEILPGFVYPGGIPVGSPWDLGYIFYRVTIAVNDITNHLLAKMAPDEYFTFQQWIELHFLILRHQPSIVLACLVCNA